MKRTEAIYGELPIDLGFIDLSPVEMMFWLYCPIKLPGSHALSIPDNLRQFRRIIEAAIRDSADVWTDKYIYVTAKTLFATAENPGNRPGWHSDGFLTSDLNYIWCDANPTVFFSDGRRHSFSADHNVSLSEMDDLCERFDRNHITYPVKHLLRLDQTVLHKVNTNITPGVRTFVKISISKDRYALAGNSINHKLGGDWTYQPRGAERNCPIGPAHIERMG